MADLPTAARLVRPLGAVIASLLACGLVAVVVHEPANPSTSPATAVPTPGGTASGGTAGGAGAVPPDSPDPSADTPGAGQEGSAPVAGGAGAPTTGPDAVPTTPPPLGPASVPAPGEYRYRVEISGDGGDRVEEEIREVVRLAGDRTAGRVEIRSRLGEQSQISTLDWSAQGAEAASTRIESALGSSEDCAWAPPLLEYEALAPGVSWITESRCETTIEGVPTSLRVSGRARVVGRDVVDVGGVPTPVWRIDRQRTTTFTADVGATAFEQTAREVGLVLLDPARGLPVQSDTTLTLSGESSGTSRRISRLEV